MRIARFVAPGSDPTFGIVELAADQQDHPDTVAVISGDPLAGPVNYTGQRFDLADVRLLSPVIPRSKVVAVAKNFAAHASEMNSVVPPSPVFFFKPNTSVIGPDDAIVRPAATEDLHYEGELAVVIGRICRKVPRERVSEVIFGYTCANDVTARDLQASEDQWARAKGWDTFCPLGPWIATHLSVEEAGQLTITTALDDEIKQQASTRLMARPIADLVTAISEFTTLLPGDVILTGTPAGVGPMVAGQRVSVEIDQIGTLTNLVVDDDSEGDDE